MTCLFPFFIVLQFELTWVEFSRCPCKLYAPIYLISTFVFHENYLQWHSKNFVIMSYTSILNIFTLTSYYQHSMKSVNILRNSLPNSNIWLERLVVETSCLENSHGILVETTGCLTVSIHDYFFNKMYFAFYQSILPHN
jgi:hypothetical protein